MTVRPRPLKLGLIAGVAVLSVAGVAAAATGALPERRPDRPVATTVVETTSTSPEATAVDVTAVDPTTVDPADDPRPVDQPDGGRGDDPGRNAGHRGSWPRVSERCRPVRPRVPTTWRTTAST